MKLNLLVAITCIFATTMGTSFAQDSVIAPHVEDCPQPTCQPAGAAGFTGGADLALFTLYGRQGAGGTGAPNNDDFFPEHEGVPGGRYWIGYEMADGLGLRGRYFHWSDDQLYNGFVREQSFQTFDLESTLDLDVFSFDLTGFAGMRHGRIQLDGSDFGGISDTYNFDGLGLTVGMEGRRRLYRSISLVGGFRYSVLYGENSFDNSPGFLDNTFLDIAELKLGAEWSKTLGSGRRLFAAISWEQQVYGTDSYMPSNIDPETLGDVSLAGPVFSIGWDR